MIAIERTYDPEVVNTVSNHYSIFPHIAFGRIPRIDCTPYIQDERNVFLAGEFGVAVFHFFEEGRYEAHYRVLPQGRGEWSLSFILVALQWMFCHDDVHEIRCRVPKGNYACRALVKRLLAEFVYTEPTGWVNQDGQTIPADIFCMTRERWEMLTNTRH